MTFVIFAWIVLDAAQLQFALLDIKEGTDTTGKNRKDIKDTSRQKTLQMLCNCKI